MTVLHIMLTSINYIEMLFSQLPSEESGKSKLSLPSRGRTYSNKVSTKLTILLTTGDIWHRVRNGRKVNVFDNQFAR